MQQSIFKLLFMLLALYMSNTVPWALAEPETINGDVPDIKNIQVLDLDTACSIALLKNPTLAAAVQRVEQAQQLVNQARGAYFPSLTAKASVNRVKQSENRHQADLATAEALNPMATSDNPQEYYEAGLTADWTLFDGFRRRFAKAAAKYGEEQSKSSLFDSRRLLLSAVAGSFYKAQLASESVAIAAADEAFNLEQIADANARHRVGTGSLSDLLNFEIQANAAKDNRIKADQEYLVAMTGLAALLGIPHASFPEELKLAPLEEEQPFLMQQPDAREQINYAYKHRPDILGNTKGIDRAEAEIGTAKAAYYPSVVISGTVNGQRSESSSFEGDDFGNTIGVFLNYSIFSGGTDQAKVARARHKKREELSNLNALKISVAREVNNVLTGISSARQQLKLQRKNATLVQQNRDLVEKEYAAGQSSLVRLNEAQRNLIQALSRLASARISLRYAWANLHTATAENLILHSQSVERLDSRGL